MGFLKKKAEIYRQAEDLRIRLQEFEENEVKRQRVVKKHREMNERKRLHQRKFGYIELVTTNILGKKERIIKINKGTNIIPSCLIDRIYPEDRDNKKRNDENMKARREVVSIVLPNSVTEIRQDAFIGFSNLRNFVMSENVETIGKKAFEGVGYINTMILPKTLKNVGENIFCGSTIEKVFAEGEQDAFRIALMLNDIYRPIQVEPLEKGDIWTVYKISGRPSYSSESWNKNITRCKMTMGENGKPKQIPYTSERYKASDDSAESLGSWTSYTGRKGKSSDDGISV